MMAAMMGIVRLFDFPLGEENLVVDWEALEPVGYATVS